MKREVSPTFTTLLMIPRYPASFKVTALDVILDIIGIYHMHVTVFSWISNSNYKYLHTYAISREFFVFIVFSYRWWVDTFIFIQKVRQSIDQNRYLSHICFCFLFICDWKYAVNNQIFVWYCYVRIFSHNNLLKAKIPNKSDHWTCCGLIV